MSLVFITVALATFLVLFVRVFYFSFSRSCVGHGPGGAGPGRAMCILTATLIKITQLNRGEWVGGQAGGWCGSGRHSFVVRKYGTRSRCWLCGAGLGML